MTFPFIVNITNQGHNDVSGLTLVVKVLGNESELGTPYTQLLDTLPSGQEVTPRDVVITVNTTETVGATLSYVATVELDGRVLDERTIAG